MNSRNTFLTTLLLTATLQASAEVQSALNYLNDQPEYIVEAGCAVFLEKDYGQPNARWIGKFDYSLNPAWFGINGQDMNVDLDGNLVEIGDSVQAQINDHLLQMIMIENIPCDFECDAGKATLEISNSVGFILSETVIYQCDI